MAAMAKAFATVVATKAAIQVTGPASWVQARAAWNRLTVTAVWARTRAMLKASFTTGMRRWTSITAAWPTARAMTRTMGETKKRPMTSGISSREID
jgi:hypothetical protein